MAVSGRVPGGKIAGRQDDVRLLNLGSQGSKGGPPILPELRVTRELW